MLIPVLVVDDSILVRKQVGAALEGHGFVVLEAVDGIDALEKLDHNPGTRLIVCDLSMPRMNGIELLQELRARRSDVPVMMLTTEGQPEHMRHARSLGAKCWLVKPFNADLLRETAQRLASVPTSSGEEVPTSRS